MKILNQSERRCLSETKGVARLFSVEIKIRLFGRVVWHIVFPPNSNIEE